MKNNPQEIEKQLKELLIKLEEILNKHIALERAEKSNLSLGKVETLDTYRDMEKAFNKEEEAYNRVIHTFNELYSETGAHENQEIKIIQSRIDTLRSRLITLTHENTEILEKEISLTQSELKVLSNKEKKQTSPFKKIGNPSYVDIQV